MARLTELRDQVRGLHMVARPIRAYGGAAVEWHPQSNSPDRPLVELRRALGDLTQAQAAPLLEVSPNTWARWERGILRMHPERARQVHRLYHLVADHGERLACRIGLDGLRGVLDSISLPEVSAANDRDQDHAPGEQRGHLVRGE